MLLGFDHWIVFHDRIAQSFSYILVDQTCTIMYIDIKKSTVQLCTMPVLRPVAVCQRISTPQRPHHSVQNASFHRVEQLPANQYTLFY